MQVDFAMHEINQDGWGETGQVSYSERLPKYAYSIAEHAIFNRVSTDRFMTLMAQPRYGQ